MTRDTVTSTMRRAAHPFECARCDAGAGCSAMKYQSLSGVGNPTRASGFRVSGSGLFFWCLGCGVDGMGRRPNAGASGCNRRTGARPQPPTLFLKHEPQNNFTLKRVAVHSISLPPGEGMGRTPLEPAVQEHHPRWHHLVSEFGVWCLGFGGWDLVFSVCSVECLLFSAEY